jgi:hypothetical protein
MTRSLRRVAFAAVVVLTIVITNLSRVGAAPPADTARITAAANVTLRQAPSADASAVAQLALGTEVIDVSPNGLDKTWIRVRLADGRDGWILSNLTRPLDAFWRWPTFDRIIAERLARKGDGFGSAAELVDFIDRVSGEYTDPDGRARIDLNRLRAVSSALSAIPSGARGRREPYTSWLATRKDTVVYDEPGGRWMLADGPIWDLHTRHMATTAADEIAWFAVTNGLSGECEGVLTCYLSSLNRLQGEYLRRQPDGRHAADAVLALETAADLFSGPPKANEVDDVVAARDCRQMVTSLDALTSAVTNTRVAPRADAITSLSALRRRCQ